MRWYSFRHEFYIIKFDMKLKSGDHLVLLDGTRFNQFQHGGDKRNRDLGSSGDDRFVTMKKRVDEPVQNHNVGLRERLT